MGAIKETVTIVRKPKVDKIKPVAGPVVEIEVSGCVVVPRASNEEDGGWVQISGYTVFAPVGSDFRADDQVRVRGQLYAVEGEPGRFPVRKPKLGIAVTLGRVATVGT